MTLSQRQLQDVCMLYSSDHTQCRYLAHDDRDTSKWYCLKKNTTYKKKADERIVDFLDDCKRKNVDPTSKSAPLGDNCKGYLILKNIEQGYDQP